MDRKKIKEIYDKVAFCNKCGFCTTICPTYLITGSEFFSPRGRNQLLRFFIEGKIDFSNLKESLQTCLKCDACRTICFSEVDTADNVIFGQSIYKKNFLFNTALNFIFKNRLHNYVFKFLLFLFSYTRQIIKFIPLLSQVDKILSAQQTINTKPIIHSNQTETNICYFSSCLTKTIYPQIQYATKKVLLGVINNFDTINNFCCGLIPYSLGNYELAKQLAKRNIELFKTAKTIIVDDSSCATFLKNYSYFFKNSEAINFKKKIKELSEFLVDFDLEKNLQLSMDRKTIVAYHHPCQCYNDSGVINEPLEILKKFKNLQLIEIEDPQLCCGGGGFFMFKYPDFSEKILKLKLSKILKTNCEQIITSAVSCILNLNYGIKKYNYNFKLFHIAEFLKQKLLK